MPLHPRIFPLIALLLLCLGLPTVVQAAAIRAEASRNPVALNESFDLVFSADARPDGPPDFSPLSQAFDILNQGQSQNVRIINGSMSASTTWTLTLMPRKAGRVEVPAIPFGSDASNPLTIEVSDAPAGQAGQTGQPGTAADQDVFIQVEVEPKAVPATVYVQQQIGLKVRLHMALQFANGTLSEPQANTPDLVIHRIGRDQQTQTFANGRRYQVIERRYALFPQQSGAIEIAPIEFQGQIGGLDPFARFNGGARAQVRRARSEPVRIEVRPIPPAASGGHWLPATGLALTEAWSTDPPLFREGESITRTLMVLANGLSAAQLPTLQGALPPEVKAYPDRPSLEDREERDGLAGMRAERIAIIPTRAGSYTLPAIELPWWNLQTNRMETARIEARTIQVLPGTGTATATPPPQAAPAQPETPASTTTAPAAAPESLVIVDPGLWPWVALCLGAGWLATALAWWLSRRSPAPSSAAPAASPRAVLSRAEAELKRACLADQPEAAGHALLAWALARWPGDPPRTLGALATRLGADGPAAAEVQELERVLYAPDKAGWHGHGLWTAIHVDSAEPAPPGVPAAPLAPLYP